MTEQERRARRTLTLIKSRREFTVGDLATYLGIPDRSAAHLSRRLASEGVIVRIERHKDMMLFQGAA